MAVGLEQAFRRSDCRESAELVSVGFGRPGVFYATLLNNG